MDPAESAHHLRISVAYSPRAGEVDEVALRLQPGADVALALAASGMRLRHPELDWDRAVVGVWGQPCALQRSLRDLDRVEVYRPLSVDPMEARRRRDRAQRELKPRARR
jgi:putative ubiquitin-RnfH superfamily antitoxin RatB of RatAB toxin-antitoxin module